MKDRRGTPAKTGSDLKSSRPTVADDDLFMDAIRLLGTKVTSKESPTQRIPGTTLGPSAARDGDRGGRGPSAGKKARGGPPSVVTEADAKEFEDAMASLDVGLGTRKAAPTKADVVIASEPAAPPSPFVLGIEIEAELDADAFEAALRGDEAPAEAVVEPGPEPEPAPRAAARPEVINDKQLRSLLDKGRLRVGSELDLHGMTLIAAHDAVLAFVAESLKDAVKVVRIVHGKGMHSRGEPVLRDLARRLLRHDLSDDVLAMTSPPERMGGEGATVCFLRTPEEAR